MSPKRQFFAALLQSLVLTLGVALTAPSALAAEDESGADKSSHQDMVLKGDAKCTRCHDETEAYPVLSIGKTRHGTIADSRTPTCTSCHGESSAHVDNPAGTKVRPEVDRRFGKKIDHASGEPQ
jgi:cytochrome c553